jgi:hypothetical protein
VQLFPFQYVRQSPFREISVDATRFNFNCDLEIAINRMKMGWPMIPVIHRDNDAEKATQFGHAAL